MMRKTSVFRRIPAIIMIQNSETDGAAYLGHFQKSLLNTNLRLVHFKMFNKEHLNLLPQCMKVETMRDTPLYCTRTPSTSPHPSLAGTPRNSSYNDVLANDEQSSSTQNNASVDAAASPSSSAVPACVMAPCDSACEDKIDYHVVGVISLGGPMCAADDANYPFLRKVITLMKSAVEEDVPVLGICLGSQMLSRALGGEVTRAPIGEMGFVPQYVEPIASFATPEAAAQSRARGIFDWFRGREELLSYHWHGDTFSIPSPAVRIATGPYCANQAFQVPHKYVLGVQWHPDIDNRKAHTWLKQDGIDSKPPTEPLTPGLVTCGEFQRMLADGSKMHETQSLADDIFSTWFEGVFKCRDERCALIGPPNHSGRDAQRSPPLEPQQRPTSDGLGACLNSLHLDSATSRLATM